MGKVNNPEQTKGNSRKEDPLRQKLTPRRKSIISTFLKRGLDKKNSLLFTMGKSSWWTRALLGRCGEPKVSTANLMSWLKLKCFKELTDGINQMVTERTGKPWTIFESGSIEEGGLKISFLQNVSSGHVIATGLSLMTDAVKEEDLEQGSVFGCQDNAAAQRGKNQWGSSLEDAVMYVRVEATHSEGNHSGDSSGESEKSGSTPIQLDDIKQEQEEDDAMVYNEDPFAQSSDPSPTHGEIVVSSLDGNRGAGDDFEGPGSIPFKFDTIKEEQEGTDEMGGDEDSFAETLDSAPTEGGSLHQMKNEVEATCSERNRSDAVDFEASGFIPFQLDDIKQEQDEEDAMVYNEDPFAQSYDPAPTHGEVEASSLEGYHFGVGDIEGPGSIPFKLDTIKEEPEDEMVCNEDPFAETLVAPPTEGGSLHPIKMEIEEGEIVEVDAYAIGLNSMDFDAGADGENSVLHAVKMEEIEEGEIIDDFDEDESSAGVSTMEESQEAGVWIPVKLETKGADEDVDYQCFADNVSPVVSSLNGSYNDSDCEDAVLFSVLYATKMEVEEAEEKSHDSGDCMDATLFPEKADSIKQEQDEIVVETIVQDDPVHVTHQPEIFAPADNEGPECSADTSGGSLLAISDNGNDGAKNWDNPSANMQEGELEIPIVMVGNHEYLDPSFQSSLVEWLEEVLEGKIRNDLTKSDKTLGNTTEACSERNPDDDGSVAVPIDDSYGPVPNYGSLEPACFGRSSEPLCDEGSSEPAPRDGCSGPVCGEGYTDLYPSDGSSGLVSADGNSGPVCGVGSCEPVSAEGSLDIAPFGGPCEPVSGDAGSEPAPSGGICEPVPINGCLEPVAFELPAATVSSPVSTVNSAASAVSGEVIVSGVVLDTVPPIQDCLPGDGGRDDSNAALMNLIFIVENILQEKKQSNRANQNWDKLSDSLSIVKEVVVERMSK